MVLHKKSINSGFNDPNYELKLTRALFMSGVNENSTLNRAETAMRLLIRPITIHFVSIYSRHHNTKEPCSKCDACLHPYNIISVRQNQHDVLCHLTRESWVVKYFVLYQ